MLWTVGKALPTLIVNSLDPFPVSEGLVKGTTGRKNLASTCGLHLLASSLQINQLSPNAHRFKRSPDLLVYGDIPLDEDRQDSTVGDCLPFFEKLLAAGCYGCAIEVAQLQPFHDTRKRHPL